jgi:hypothetical protein
MLKNIFLLPLRFCANCVKKFFDFIISAMRLSALNWLGIGRRAADAGLDVAESAKNHAKELRARIEQRGAK